MIYTGVTYLEKLLKIWIRLKTVQQLHGLEQSITVCLIGFTKSIHLEKNNECKNIELNATFAQKHFTVLEEYLTSSNVNLIQLTIHLE